MPKKRPTGLRKEVGLTFKNKPKKGWSQGCRARYNKYALKMAGKGVTVISLEKWAQINC